MKMSSWITREDCVDTLKYYKEVCVKKTYICSSITAKSMNKRGFLYRTFDLYYEGFKSMRLGRTLWAIILIKLFIIFAVLKVFFFPNFLKEHAGGDEAGYVATELVDRAVE